VNIYAEYRMRRQPCFTFAIIALVAFGLLLALNSSALAQSNIPAGTPLVPSVTAPLSSSSVAPAAPASKTLTPLALPVPVAVAAVPGAPAALSTTSALPALAPAPAVVTGGTVPTPQSIFTCSCFGVGLGTRWVGQVQSTSFQNAATAAAGQCTALAINGGTLSPYITPSGGVSLGRNPFPTVNPNGVPGDVATNFRGTTVFTQTSAATIGVPARAAGCARCACD
jgi:hypothetical protein